MTSWHGNGPLARYVKLRVAHAPGMPGTFSPLPWFSDPAMHHGTCVTHEPWYMAGSLTSGFLWSQWRGKRPRHSWCMRNPQVYISGKRPMVSRLLTLGVGNRWIFPFKESVTHVQTRWNSSNVLTFAIRLHSWSSIHRVTKQAISRHSKAHNTSYTRPCME